MGAGFADMDGSRVRSQTDVVGARVIAVANQKGGVAKTTTVASLGDRPRRARPAGPRWSTSTRRPASPSRSGSTPRSSSCPCTTCCWAGSRPRWRSSRPSTGADLLPVDDRPGRVRGDAAHPDRAGVRAAHAPSSEVRDGYDSSSSTAPRRSASSRSTRSRRPTDVLIPLQCETLSHRGVGQLLDTVHDVQRLTNPRARGARRAADAVRRPHQPCPPGPRRRLDALRRSRSSSRPSRSRCASRRPGRGPVDPARLRPPKGAAAYREHAQRLSDDSGRHECSGGIRPAPAAHARPPTTVGSDGPDTDGKRALFSSSAESPVPAPARSSSSARAAGSRRCGRDRRSGPRGPRCTSGCGSVTAATSRRSRCSGGTTDVHALPVVRAGELGAVHGPGVAGRATGYSAPSTRSRSRDGSTRSQTPATSPHSTQRTATASQSALPPRSLMP